MTPKKQIKKSTVDAEIKKLALLFRKNKRRSSIPFLQDPKIAASARSLAKVNGVWSELNELDTSEAIPALKRSDCRAFARTGDRKPSQQAEILRAKNLNRAALALWLDHPKADVDYLQDLMWAYCDDWTWVMAAHEGCSIDLGSSAVGVALAEIAAALGERLEEEVKQRVAMTVGQRLFEPYGTDGPKEFWTASKMNWNSVCNGNIIRAALCLIEDQYLLARLIGAAVRNMVFFIDGFTDDGGCTEGATYWEYGFGHFLYAAHALHLKTGGELNLMEDSSGKLKRICEYPYAAYIEAPLRATFGDVIHGYVSARTAMTINYFFDMPSLYAFCERHVNRALKVRSWHELAMYSGFKVEAEADSRDYILPELGLAKMRGDSCKKQMTVLCVAGNNGVEHNHNDIGSFIAHKHGRILLADPGAPAYTRKTFGPERYDILYCNALGHSVPVIDGVLQREGGEYFGVMTAENMNGQGLKTVRIDMTRAYPDGLIKSFIRSFTLDSRANTMVLEDVFEFEKTPSSLEEAFMTFESVRIMACCALIGMGRVSMTLTAESARGRFKLIRVKKQHREGSFDPAVNRIVFVPAKLERGMALRFRFE